jgi:hypothetical protein
VTEGERVNERTRIEANSTLAFVKSEKGWTVDAPAPAPARSPSTGTFPTSPSSGPVPNPPPMLDASPPKIAAPAPAPDVPRRIVEAANGTPVRLGVHATVSKECTLGPPVEVEVLISPRRGKIDVKVEKQRSGRCRAVQRSRSRFKLSSMKLLLVIREWTTLHTK